MNVDVITFEASTPAEIESAFARMAREHADAVFVSNSSLLFSQRRQIAGLALSHRIASIAVQREYPESGCLMNYGQNIADNFRGAATYVDKILKGAKPGDLPIEQPTRFELVINLKTAKALGLAIPTSLRRGADEVIE